MYLSSSFSKKSTIISLLMALVFLISFIATPHADALNAGSGSKENSFVGYRSLNSTQIQFWADKNIGSTFYPGQFKIYEGTDPSTGRQIDVNGVAAVSGSNISCISGLSGGGIVKITSAESFVPGQVYTIVVTSTLKSNNGLTLGHFNNHNDIVFSFAAPDTSGTYSTSITPIINFYPLNNATNVPVEGLISFSLDVPMDTDTATAFSTWSNPNATGSSTLVLKKNGVPVNYDYNINTTKDGDIYAPIVSDDRTFVFFPMTGQGQNISYNLDSNTPYTLDIPAINLINGQTIPAQTISFTTAPDDVPTAFSSAPTKSTSDGNLSIFWQPISAVTGVSPAATGYNVWASTDPYFGFSKLNSTPISAPTTSYVGTDLQPSYFRVTAINGSAEGGFSDTATAVTVSNPSTNGFTVAFAPAVNGLTATNFALDNGASISSVATTDNGATYTVTAALTAGTTYHVTVTKSSYTFTVGTVQVPAPSQVAPPTATPASGATVASGSTVNLSTTTAGATIYYTTDGNTPTTGSASGSSVTVTGTPGATVTVKAFAVNTGMADSAVASFSYTIMSQVVTPASGGGVGGGSTDTQAPTWPTGAQLTVSNNQGVVTLTWPAATDNVGVTRYQIFMDSNLLDSVDGKTTTYTYNAGQGSGIAQKTFSVKAGDAAGNWSTTGLSGQAVGGDNPVQYQGTFLATINGSTSVQGVSVDGNNNVPVMPTIEIYCLRNIAADGNCWPNNQQCISLQDSSGASVPINVFRLSGDPSSLEKHYIFFTPLSDLSTGKTYKIIISPNLKANNGKTLGDETNNQSIVVTFSIGGSAAAAGGVDAITPNGPTSTNGTATVDPAVGATVGQGSDAFVVIPANALKETSPVPVNVLPVKSPPAAPQNAKPASDVFEFTVGGKSTYSFTGNVTLRLNYNTSAIGADETPAIYYYDESLAKWVNIGGTVSGSTISVQVGHFTKFAVFSIKKAANVPVVEQPAVTLNDIAGHWAENSIKKLFTLGAVNGYSDGSFKPDNNITRAEFATILVKAFKLSPRGGKVFTDTAGHWAQNTIATAASYDIVGGYDADIFGPDDLITREQMAVMVVKATKLPMVTDETTFADSASISDWARIAVDTATKNGIIKEYPDNTFQPQGNATRAEAVMVIVNALK